MALSAALRADPSELLWGPGGALPCPAASHSQGTQPSQPQAGWPAELGQTLNTEKGLIPPRASRLLGSSSRFPLHCRGLIMT